MLSLSLPELVRVDTSNADLTIAQIIYELTPTGGGFNYLPATKCVKAAHKGIHRLDLLLASQRLRDGSVGSKANFEVASMACPLAFGRSTKVIDLSPRSFQFGAGRSASYRIPFCFVEDKVIKIYFLQPRKNTIFLNDNFGLFVSIVKKHLLDSEFFGEKTDIEIVDLSEKTKGSGRVAKTYTMSDFEIWEDHRIQAHLSKIVEALAFIEAEKLIAKQRRPLKDKELPLFS